MLLYGLYHLRRLNPVTEASLRIPEVLKVYQLMATPDTAIATEVFHRLKTAVSQPGCAELMSGQLLNKITELVNNDTNSVLALQLLEVCYVHC